MRSLLFGCRPFGCLTALGVKRAELVQKFVPRSRIGIFHTHLKYPIGTLTDVLLRFVLFGCIRTVWIPYETRCKMGRTSAKVRAMKSRRNFSQLMFWCISYYLGAFGTVWLPYETRCKMAELVQKFVPRSRFGMFRNKRT